MKPFNKISVIDSRAKLEIHPHSILGRQRVGRFRCSRTYTPICLSLLLGLFFLFSKPATATDLPIEGGPGGNPFRAECPKGSYLMGVQGRYGAWIDQLQPLCAPWLADKKMAGLIAPLESIGASPGGRYGQTSCPNYPIVGLNMVYFIVGEDHKPKFASNIHIACREIPALFGKEETETIVGYSFNFKLRPSLMGQYCPKNEWPIGLHGRAGLFVDALGLICGPPPPTPGTIAPSHARNMTSLYLNAPRIIQPQGFIIKGKGVFKIIPSKALTGTHAIYQLHWLNPPASLQGKGLDFYTEEILMNIIAGPGGLPTPEDLLAPGRWEIRARISQPRGGDWSPWVQFEYYLQNLGTSPKPNAPLPLEHQSTPSSPSSKSPVFQPHKEGGQPGVKIFRPQTSPSQGFGGTEFLRSRGIDEQETQKPEPDAEKKP